MAAVNSKSRVLRVLVVDDSSVVREFLRSVIDEEPDMLVVGTAQNGADTLELVQKLQPDLVTMDVAMPRMDGVEATRQIMALKPTPIAIVTNQPVGPDAPTTFNALAAGAVEVLRKPGRETFERNPAERDAFVRQLRNVGYVGVVGLRRPVVRPSSDPSGARTPSPVPLPSRQELPRRSRASDSSPAPRRLQIPSSASLIAIGCSTGGPPALRAVLGLLDPKQAPPIVVVQHMSLDFLTSFADWLNGVCPLPVSVAVGGAFLKPGHVYIAPSEKHLTVTRRAMTILDTPPVQFQKPSADVLFQSVAQSHGDSAIGLVLTGMGRDGAEGLLAMHRAGACTIAQDEQSSLVYGMPRAAAELGAAQLEATPDQTARLLSRVWFMEKR